MSIIVSCEFRFFQTPDGKVWTPSSYQYNFWLRYLAVFNKVTVVARVKQVSFAQENWQLSSGEQVSFFSLPYYVGIVGLIKNLPKTINKLKKLHQHEGLILCRVPSQTANLITLLFAKKRKMAFEVVGDPYDVFSSGVGSFIAPILRFSACRSLKKQCQLALGVSYVTQHYLQQRYPPAKESISSYYSSIMLTQEQFASTARTYHQPARKLIFVGSLAQLYKAPDVLIAAFARLAANDKNFQLTILGSGLHQAELEQLAINLGIAEQINFIGEVASNEVLGLLQQADIFVLPSRTEGLPRAMIEAMAQGMACIGSDAGGIPELLEARYCVEKDNIDALHLTLQQLCDNIDQLNQQAQQNFIKAQAYSSTELDLRRNQFYQQLRDKI